MPSFVAILANTQRSYPGIMRLFAAVSWFFGLVFMMTAIYQAAALGESGAREGGWGKPAATLIAGACMFSLPQLIAALTMTFYEHSSSPLAYVHGAGSGSMLGPIFGLVQLLGVLAVIKAVIKLKHLGDPLHRRSETMGQVWAHMIGGVAAINIQYTIHVIANTIGWNVTQYLH